LGKTSVDIYHKIGFKICQIDAPQKWYSDFTIPTPIPFLGVKYKDVWNNPNFVIRWAWLHAFLIVQINREFASITKDTTSYCAICNEKSMKPKSGLLARNSIFGFCCVNEKCPMHNVKIPIELVFNLQGMPDELAKDLKASYGIDNYTVWNNKNFTY
jgi:hypothetical protein